MPQRKRTAANTPKESTRGVEANGEKISWLRRWAGVSQEDFAASVGIAKNHLQNIEANVTGVSSQVLDCIARVLRDAYKLLGKKLELQAEDLLPEDSPGRRFLEKPTPKTPVIIFLTGDSDPATIDNLREMLIWGGKKAGPIIDKFERAANADRPFTPKAEKGSIKLTLELTDLEYINFMDAWESGRLADCSIEQIALPAKRPTLLSTRDRRHLDQRLKTSIPYDRHDNYVRENESKWEGLAHWLSQLADQIEKSVIQLDTALSTGAISAANAKQRETAMAGEATESSQDTNWHQEYILQSLKQLEYLKGRLDYIHYKAFSSEEGAAIAADDE